MNVYEKSNKNLLFPFKGCYAKPFNESLSQFKTVPSNIHDVVEFCREDCQNYFLLYSNLTYQCITSNVPMGGTKSFVFVL